MRQLIAVAAAIQMLLGAFWLAAAVVFNVLLLGDSTASIMQLVGLLSAIPAGLTIFLVGGIAWIAARRPQ